ncbi:MAG: IS66 family transposase [Chloroflexi bacterium]|nr:IS66 family transposase [Chloroflexota bacterium]
MQAEVQRLSAPKKTSENSSVPPSAGFKANRTERRRRRCGTKRGHPGTSRGRQRLATSLTLTRPTAHDHIRPLPLVGQRRVGRSQVVELPPVRPIVIEGWQYAARCRGCGTRTKGADPAGLEPTRTFGPRIEALLGYFHERHHVGYERLVETCREVFGLTISEGGIDGALRRLAERARPTSEAIGAQVRAGPVIGSDETSARVAGRTAWRWVFQTPEASYHVIVPRRNADVIAAFLGEARPESWVSDLWLPQIQVDAETHQFCLAQQIRNLSYAAEADGYDGLVWAIELRHLPSRAINLHAIRDTLTPASFARRRQRIENAVDRLVFRTVLPTVSDTANARRRQARYRDHRASLFVFLDRPDVSPTDNASEQDLRPSVIHRTVTGGYRSWAGAEISAIFTSLFATARKQGNSFLDLLRSIAPPPPFTPPACLAEQIRRSDRPCPRTRPRPDEHHHCHQSGAFRTIGSRACYWCPSGRRASS